jgi:tRNA A-37 threonylcarbamoyl transferase component Bud32
LTSFLNQFNQPCDVNVQLTLVDDSILDCQRVVRVVPNKRVVCKAIWQGKAVYAKLFLGANAAKYAARDAAGVKLMSDANIDTPALLLQTETSDKTAQVLIFEAIEPSLTAEQIWPDLTANQSLSLAKNLVAELAKHHNVGLLQTDLYLKNFLVANNEIYTLDGDGIRKFEHLKDDQAMQNLAVLCAKFDVLEVEKWQGELAETYSDARVWHEVIEPEKLATMANVQRLKAASSYADKKVFRQCTDVNVREINSGLQSIFYAASSHAVMNMPQKIAELDALITPQNLLKNGNTCTVALAEIDSKKVVLKRYNIKSFWHAISRAFRPTRAAVSWANAHRLKIFDIATAQPIALIEQRKLSFIKGKAYFLTEYVDAPNVNEYFEQTQNKAARAEAVKNIVTLFYRLYLLQISHGDMKATNIKIVDNMPVLIDLDSMRQHKKYFSSSVAHLKDLNRFMQNWQNQPALYNAFVKTFKVIYPDVAILIKAGIGANIDMVKEISS